MKPIVILISRIILIGISCLGVPAMMFSLEAQAQDARANQSVNLRAGPSTTYSIITTIPEGSLVRILGCTESYEWCGVDYRGTEGYSAGRYLTVTSGQYSDQIITGVGVGLALSIPLWHYNHWRPPHYRPPGHRPPGYRPPGNRPPVVRPPIHRPPGSRPPVVRPPIHRPPGSRPPGVRPPISNLPGVRPPSNRPPGMRPPGNRPGTRPVHRSRPAQSSRGRSSARRSGGRRRR